MAGSSFPTIQSAQEKIAKEADINFVYALYRIDNVCCKEPVIALSDVTTLRRIHTIEDDAGKALIGEDNYNRSSQIQSGAFPPAGSGGAKPVYFPFANAFGLNRGFGMRSFPFLDPTISDCVVECRFLRETDPKGSNDRLMFYHSELESVMSAIRLLTDSPVYGVGPVEIRFHPISPQGGYGTGNLDHDILGVRHLYPAPPLMIDAPKLAELRLLFKNLRNSNQIRWTNAAITRLHLSNSMLRPIDRIIDCAIGLESLFTGSAQDVRFRCAALLGESSAERLEISENVSAIARCRNAIVHGTSDPEKAIKETKRFESADNALSCARNLLRRSLLKAVTSNLEREEFRAACDQALMSGDPFLSSRR